ncbi:hypothetical protein [Spirosoma rigui]|uniref:hypothetical protein n=1 Tax=Spirosoma rigui TaxID=564064 RepID=UPI0009B190C9|nr:hypothetical protein [Spirosoma rigui]
MNQRIKALAVVGLIAGLLVLIAARPWGKINKAIGFGSPVDTLAVHPDDSLIIEQVSLTLPQTVSDSLTYKVNTRKKKRAYLEDQSAWYQAENIKLDSALKVKKRRLQQKQQSLVSMEQIDRLLSKQNRGGKVQQDLQVSDLKTELNQRTEEGKSQNP